MTRVGEVPVPDPRPPEPPPVPQPDPAPMPDPVPPQPAPSARWAMRRFADRASAGRELADRLHPYQGHPHAIVLGLARGGMPVAFEVARTLELALDVFVVRKLGVPGQQELAIGAIASGGVRVLNRQVIDALGLSTAEIEAVAEREQIELDRRERAYRGRRAPVTVAGRLALLVDDGLATGASMRAAVQALK